MKSQEKAKMITLAATIVCLAAVGTGIYFFTRGGEQRQETTQAENTGYSAASSGAEAAENDKPANISDGFVFISGGTFSMGSPETEKIGRASCRERV